MSQTNRIDLRIGFGAKGRGIRAKNFGLGLELNVNLKTNNRLVPLVRHTSNKSVCAKNGKDGDDSRFWIKVPEPGRKCSREMCAEDEIRCNEPRFGPIGDPRVGKTQQTDRASTEGQTQRRLPRSTPYCDQRDDADDGS